MAESLSFPTGQSISANRPAYAPVAIVLMVVTIIIFAAAVAFGWPIGQQLGDKAREAANVDEEFETPTLGGAV